MADPAKAEAPIAPAAGKGGKGAGFPISGKTVKKAGGVFIGILKVVWVLALIAGIVYVLFNAFNTWDQKKDLNWKNILYPDEFFGGGEKPKVETPATPAVTHSAAYTGILASVEKAKTAEDVSKARAMVDANKLSSEERTEILGVISKKSADISGGGTAGGTKTPADASKYQTGGSSWGTYTIVLILVVIFVIVFRKRFSEGFKKGIDKFKKKDEQKKEGETTKETDKVDQYLGIIRRTEGELVKAFKVLVQSYNKKLEKYRDINGLENQIDSAINIDIAYIFDKKFEVKKINELLVQVKEAQQEMLRSCKTAVKLSEEETALVLEFDNKSEEELDPNVKQALAILDKLGLSLKDISIEIVKDERDVARFDELIAEVEKIQKGEEAVKYVNLRGRFGTLILFSKDEHKKIDAIAKLVEESVLSIDDINRAVEELRRQKKEARKEEVIIRINALLSVIQGELSLANVNVQSKNTKEAKKKLVSAKRHLEIFLRAVNSLEDSDFKTQKLNEHSVAKRELYSLAARLKALELPTPPPTNIPPPSSDKPCLRLKFKKENCTIVGDKNKEFVILPKNAEEDTPQSYFFYLSGDNKKITIDKEPIVGSKTAAMLKFNTNGTTFHSGQNSDECLSFDKQNSEFLQMSKGAWVGREPDSVIVIGAFVFKVSEDTCRETFTEPVNLELTKRFSEEEMLTFARELSGTASEPHAPTSGSGAEGPIKATDLQRLVGKGEGTYKFRGVKGRFINLHGEVY